MTEKVKNFIQDKLALEDCVRIGPWVLYKTNGTWGIHNSFSDGGEIKFKSLDEAVRAFSCLVPEGEIKWQKLLALMKRMKNLLKHSVHLTMQRNLSTNVREVKK